MRNRVIFRSIFTLNRFSNTIWSYWEPRRKNIDLFLRVKSCPSIAMQAPRGRGNSSYSFLISALKGWVVNVTTRPRFTPGTYWTGGWVDLRAGLNTAVRANIFCLCQGSNPGNPVSSQSYPSSSFWEYIFVIFQIIWLHDEYSFKGTYYYAMSLVCLLATNFSAITD
jgi:hypothetical protein